MTRYNFPPPREHPKHTRAEWRNAVAHRLTIAGYFDWTRIMQMQALATPT